MISMCGSRTLRPLRPRCDGSTNSLVPQHSLTNQIQNVRLLSVGTEQAAETSVDVTTASDSIRSGQLAGDCDTIEVLTGHKLTLGVEIGELLGVSFSVLDDNEMN